MQTRLKSILILYLCKWENLPRGNHQDRWMDNRIRVALHQGTFRLDRCKEDRTDRNWNSPSAPVNRTIVMIHPIGEQTNIQAHHRGSQCNSRSKIKPRTIFISEQFRSRFRATAQPFRSSFQAFFFFKICLVSRSISLSWLDTEQFLTRFRAISDYFSNCNFLLLFSKSLPLNVKACRWNKVAVKKYELISKRNIQIF